MQDTEGFARHRLRSTPHGGQLCRGISGSFGLESVAALAWNQRQLCYGISGSIRVEQVAALPWNWWQDSPGIGGSFGVEYAGTRASTPTAPIPGPGVPGTTAASRRCRVTGARP